MKPFALALALMAVLAWGGSLIATPGSATFTDSAQVAGNTLATDTLSAPTGVNASGGASVALTWTATTDTYASGHRVYRASTSGGSYSQVAQVTPRTTTTYVDSPGAGTYYYVVRAYFQNWESNNSSEVSATVSAVTNTGFLACTAQAANTAASGDNNGYQANAGNLCASDNLYGVDTDSGTNTNTNCDDNHKDRHTFSNFGSSIPAGSQVQGIEVKLDAFADSTTGAPFLCVQLSGDALANLTTPKNSSGLGTTESSFILGGSSDLWGSAWTTSNLTNANFRVVVSNVAGDIQRDFSLDHVAVRVTYKASANTGLLDCTANAAETASSGDNNGFETAAANACANGGGAAVDTDSGTNNATGCADTHKDRHIFSSYGLSVPAGSAISGIEVRLDEWAESTANGPFSCVELSWNSGTSWTAAKTTATLTTGELTYTLGSATDAWGRTWSTGELSNGNFRVRITNVASNTGRDFSLDWAAVRVTYVAP